MGRMRGPPSLQRGKASLFSYFLKSFVEQGGSLVEVISNTKGLSPFESPRRIRRFVANRENEGYTSPPSADSVDSSSIPLILKS